MERKLTVILSAGANGRSGLRRDAVATPRTLTAHQEAMRTLIPQHRGRVVDTPGSNLVAEFASAVNAVQCAVEIQQVLKARNAELPDHLRIEFNIGINRGDTIIEGNRAYGDGVDVAAWLRIGGICISGAVYDQIKNSLALGYEPLGGYTVKNMADLVRVYRVRIGPGRAGLRVATGKRAGLRYWRRAALAAVAVLVVGAGALALWTS